MKTKEEIESLLLTLNTNRNNIALYGVADDDQKSRLKNSTVTELQIMLFNSQINAFKWVLGE